MLPFISQVIAIVSQRLPVSVSSCLVSWICTIYQTLITFYLDSCSCISTGFQRSSISAFRRQIKQLWSGPPPALNPHLCNHAQRLVFQQPDHRPLPDGSWNHITTFLAGFLLSKAVTHTFELHREGRHTSHLLTFQMPQIKENIND